MRSSQVTRASRRAHGGSEAHAMLARLRHGRHETSGNGKQVEQPHLPLPWGGKTVPADETLSKMLLKVDEASHLLSLSRKMIYDLIGRGELASLKIGGCRRIPLRALHDFIAHLEEVA